MAGHSGQQGYSLLELLVVITILIAVATIGTGTFRGVHEDANDRLVRVEMQDIAKAVRQFKQDTGYYPKTGPFQLSNSDGVPHGNLPAWAGSTDAERILWFYSPANFYQLLTSTSPLNGTGHQLEHWDPETGRGWRGPYLTGHVDGFLDIRNTINSGTTPAGNWAGSPVGGNNGNNLPDVEGIADPFEHHAEIRNGSSLLDWSITSGGTEREIWGRPYLLFGLDDQPWLVSMGPNGDYDSTTAPALAEEDDIILTIE